MLMCGGTMVEVPHEPHDPLCGSLARGSGQDPPPLPLLRSFGCGTQKREQYCGAVCIAPVIRVPRLLLPTPPAAGDERA